MIVRGDCLKKLGNFPNNSFDALVTDPPAGISFMGKDWDSDKGGRDEWIAWLESVMRECYRVMKPGAHGLVWAIPRTSHWTGLACERAGFEIRDSIAHLFGSGFPKSHNLKGEFQGIGTALKPAREDWWLIRKPLEKGLTVAENVLKWGCGGLNIDECRLESPGRKTGTKSDGDEIEASPTSFAGSNKRSLQSAYDMKTQGRWPANVLFDEESAALLDQQSGPCKTGGANRKGSGYQDKMVGGKVFRPIETYRECDGIGASRFFYVAKASKRERNMGLEGMEAKRHGTFDCTDSGGNKLGRKGKEPTEPQQNFHPTVKPTKLMEYLIKLVCPESGIVLDPFCGSGTTGIAAKKLGVGFIGIEMNDEYAEIAEKRIAHAEEPA